MALELWAVRLDRDLTEEETALLLPLLPPARRERLEGTKKALWREPLCVYGALALAMGKLFHWKTLPEIALTPQGKPCFPDHPEAAFSLSHTRGAVLAGTAQNLVGVDIERVRPVRRRTVELLASGAKTDEAFFQDWVRREARAKRTGIPVGGALRREAPPCPGERYQSFALFPGCAAGAAWDENEPLGEVRRYTADQLLAELAAFFARP